MFEYVCSTYRDVMKHDIKEDFSIVKKKLELMNCQRVESLLNKLNIQSFKLENKLEDKFALLNSSVFSFDYNTLNTEHICDVVDDNTNFITLNLEKDKLIIDLPSVHSLGEFINITNNKYIFIPILYGSIGTAKVLHMAMMVLFLDDKEVYLLEPNNRPTYFNKFVDCDISYHIETFFNNYFEMLDYNYVYIDSWNSGYKILNTGNYKNFIIDSGHCVILSIMLAHFLNNTDLSPNQIYNIFSSLNIDEIGYLIQEYSCGIYSIMVNQ